MATITQGMFGVTPEELMAQRQQALNAQALQYSQLDPMQQAQMSFYKAGSQLGTGLGGLMGAQDPELMRVRQRQQMLQGLDLTNSESLLAKAQEASQRGDYQTAQELTVKAQAIKAAQTEAGYKSAQAASQLASAQANIAKAAAEEFSISDKGRAQKLAESGKFTTESISNYIAGKGQLETIDKLAKPQADWVAKAVELGFGDKPAYGEYKPEQVAKVNAELMKEDLTKKTAAASRQTTNVMNTQESAFAKARGGDQAALLKAATDNAQGASAALARINAMEAKNASGTLYTGPQANISLETANFLSSVGLLSPDQATKLTDSTSYDKMAKDLVMLDLGGKLGAQISDADRKFVEARIPQLTTSPQARAELLQKLKDINMGKIKVWQKMNEYANTKGNLNEFDFSQNYVPVAAMPKAPTAPKLSDTDLINKYKTK